MMNYEPIEALVRKTIEQELEPYRQQLGDDYNRVYNRCVRRALMRVYLCSTTGRVARATAEESNKVEE